MGEGRGQSEPLGFLLVFGVVVLTIALVGVTGFVGLEQAQDYQRTATVERGFVALAASVDDVTRGGAPGRTTEIRLAGGSLSLTTAETTITAEYTNGTTSTYALETGALVYESGSDTTLVYRSGALVRRDGGSAVLLREPGFHLTSDGVVLPVVDATQVRGGKTGGTTAVSVRTRRAGTRLLATGASVDTVTVNVTSPRAPVWERYFRDADGPVTSVTRSGDTVRATVDTSRLYLTVYRVDVAFQ